MKFINLLFFLFLKSFLIAQISPVDVAEMTIKLPIQGGKEFLYGFESGDKILLSIHVKDGKTLKKLTISEYPDTERFNDLEITQISEKQISVANKGIYSFKLKNTSFKSITCKIKIQRIPESEASIKFNTQVKWVTVRDTVFTNKNKKVVSGYDTINTEKTRWKLIKVDTQVVQITSNNEIVHSRTKMGAENYSIINFKFPAPSSYQLNDKERQQEEFVSWAYSLSVDNSTNKENINQANNKAISLGKAAIAMVAPQYTAVATVALYGINFFTPPPLNSDNIIYEIKNQNNLLVDAGNSSLVVKKMATYTPGNYHIVLTNDNIRTGVNINFCVYAVKLIKTYQEENYIKQKTKAIIKDETIQVPKITKRKIPIMSH